MFGVLLVHLGYYMILPILPILLKTEVNLSLVQIGMILGVSSISFQIGSIIGGFLADRLGRRFIIGLGAILRAGGLFGFGAFGLYGLLLLSAVANGIGGGLNGPSTKAAIATLASKENQTTAFSMRGIAANMGTAAAGLIVFFFLVDSTRSIFYVAAGIYVVLGIMSWILLPKNCGEAPCPEIPRGAYREVWRNKPFL